MMGIRAFQGRGITEDDVWGAQRVAVVNRNLAAREFEDGEAIGRHIRVVDDGEQWSTVVGVVEIRPLSASVHRSCRDTPSTSACSSIRRPLWSS